MNWLVLQCTDWFYSGLTGFCSVRGGFTMSWVVLLCPEWFYCVLSGFTMSWVVLQCPEWFYCVLSGFTVSWQWCYSVLTSVPQSVLKVALQYSGIMHLSWEWFCSVLAMVLVPRASWQWFYSVLPGVLFYLVVPHSDSIFRTPWHWFCNDVLTDIEHRISIQLHAGSWQ